MDAVEYLKAEARMCTVATKGCQDCDLKGICLKSDMPSLKERVERVETWAKYHPEGEKSIDVPKVWHNHGGYACSDDCIVYYKDQNGAKWAVVGTYMVDIDEYSRPIGANYWAETMTGMIIPNVYGWSQLREEPERYLEDRHADQ